MHLRSSASVPPRRWPAATLPYELVTSRAAAGRSLVLTSNRSPDWYPLFLNPVVAESLLGRLINTSHQVFMNGPSYRPNTRPVRATATPKEASE